MRLKKFVIRISRGRRLRFGSVFARVIESQPLAETGCTDRGADQRQCDSHGETR